MQHRQGLLQQAVVSIPRLLIDINVLLDVALGRPGAPASARLLGLCGVQHGAGGAGRSTAADKRLAPSL